MASCSFNASGRTFTLSVWQNSVNYQAGTVNVGWTLSISGGGGTWFDSYARAVVNGSEVYNATQGWSSGTFPAADGSVSGSMNVNTRSTSSIGFSMEGYSDSYSVQSASGSCSVTQTTAYTVSYSANGGSGAPSSQTKYINVPITLSTTQPTRTGYTFQGWATSSGGSVSYNPGSTYSANASQTLYAVWKINTWTVSYNANGGSDAPAPQTKIYGQTLTLSSVSPTRSGYAFKGWATNTSSAVVYQPGGSYTDNQGATLYAVWEVNQWTVSYSANGGSGAPGNQTKIYGQTLTLSSTRPTKASEGGTYTITYNANGGSCSKTSESLTNQTTYAFDSWNTSSDGNGTAYASGGSYTANAAVTLYAQWTPTKISQSTELPSATRSGASFKGWSESASAEGGVTGQYTPKSNVTLYAIWDVYTEAKLVLTGYDDITAFLKEGNTIKLRGTTDATNDMTLTLAHNAEYDSSTKTTNIWVTGSWGSDSTPDQNCADNPLYIYGSGTVVPDMDYICESDNHLWGCSSKARTIYSSALGDPTDFETYAGVSTDAYAVAVGSSDEFTGCCKLGSSVLFFKRHTIHKMLGSYPAEYALYTYNYDGVSEGNYQSLKDCGGSVLYMSEHGVVSYSGSSPSKIGTVLGDLEMTGSSAGYDGECYFMSATNADGDEHLYIYDTRYGLWMIEDDMHMDSFARVGKDNYILSKNTIYKTNSSEDILSATEWLLTFKPFYETVSGTYNSTSHVFEKKRYSRIVLRMELPYGSYIKVETKGDSSPWRLAGELHGENNDVRQMIISTPRVDKLQLRISGTGPCTILAMEREYLIGSMR